MQIDFTGRQMEVTEDMRRYTVEHSRKLSRFLSPRAHLHVILTAQRHLRIAEITVKIRQQTLVGIGETASAQTSIKEALDKLERQVVRRLERRRSRKRRPRPTTAFVLHVLRNTRNDHHEREAVERERFPLEPLSLEEAIASLQAATRGVVVFRNTGTERVNVVYRRPDGKLGLIEPEP